MISIAPLHNIDSFKRCLARHENLNFEHGPNTTNNCAALFLTTSSQSPMAQTSKINIIERTGAGSTPQTALALVVTCGAT